MYARAKRPRAHRFGEDARVLTDDDALVHPEPARSLDLLRRARSPVDRPRPRGASQLHGRRPDARPDGVYEHALARLKSRLREERVVRGDEDLGHGRGLREVERTGNQREVAFGDDRVLGLRAARRDAEDTLPRLQTSNLVARLLDLARELKAGYLRDCSRRRGIAPALLQQVRAVQPRRANPHAHAVGESDGPRDLTDFEPPAVLVRDDTHGPHTLFAHRAPLRVDCLDVWSPKLITE